MKHKKAVLALMVFVMSFVMSFTVMTRQAFAVDLSSANSLTVYPLVSSSEDSNVSYDATGIVIDLYQLAAAKEIPGVDSYTYEFASDYSGITLSNGISMSDLSSGTVSLNNDLWNEVAQLAAGIARNGSSKLVEGAAADSTISGLSAGLYLIVARGSNDSNYWTEETDDSGKTNIVSSANVNGYTYLFSPGLISLPTKNAVEIDGVSVVNTANDGDWIYNATVNLKHTEKPLYGGIVISKSINDFKGNEEVTFVFRVTASVPGDDKYTYENVAAVSFNAAGTNTAVLDHIRAGAVVEVEEVYTGLKYDFGGITYPEPNVVVAGEDEEHRIVFTASNTFNSDGSGGHGIQNHFTNVESEDGNYWDVSQQTAAVGLN